MCGHRLLCGVATKDYTWATEVCFKSVERDHVVISNDIKVRPV